MKMKKTNLPRASIVLALLILAQAASTTCVWQSYSRSSSNLAPDNVACRWLCQILRKEVASKKLDVLKQQFDNFKEEDEILEEADFRVLRRPFLRSQLMLLRLIKERHLDKRLSHRVARFHANDQGEDDSQKKPVYNINSHMTILASMKLHGGGTKSTMTQSKSNSSDNTTALILDFHIKLKLNKLEVQLLQNGAKLPLTIELSNDSTLQLSPTNMDIASSTPSPSTMTSSTLMNPIVRTQLPPLEDVSNVNDEDVMVSSSWLSDAQMKSSLSRPCEASQTDYCFFKGECVQLYSLNITICKCQPGFKGTRCEMYDILSIDSLPAEDSVVQSIDGHRHEPDASSERQPRPPSSSQVRNPFDVVIDEESST